MVFQQSVLIVDGCPETQEVLRTALERRGLRILAATRARRGLELARRHQPDLIVLDLEVDDSGAEDVGAPFVRESGRRHTPLIMLGTVRRHRTDPSGGEFILKPYHFGPLIHRIEELLSATGRASSGSA